MRSDQGLHALLQANLALHNGHSVMFIGHTYGVKLPAVGALICAALISEITLEDALPRLPERTSSFLTRNSFFKHSRGWASDVLQQARSVIEACPNDEMPDFSKLAP